MMKITTVIYVVMVVVTFGWVWHRDCNIRWDTEGRYSRAYEQCEERARNGFLSTACSAMSGLAWPIYWPINRAVTYLDPNTLKELPRLELHIGVQPK